MGRDASARLDCGHVAWPETPFVPHGSDDRCRPSEHAPLRESTEEGAAGEIANRIPQCAVYARGAGMFMVYLDESGSPYKDYATFCSGYETRAVPGAGSPMPPYPFFVLAAVGIAESHLPMVEEWFSAMKRSFLRNVSSFARQEIVLVGSARSHPSWRSTGIPRATRTLVSPSSSDLWQNEKSHSRGSGLAKQARHTTSRSPT